MGDLFKSRPDPFMTPLDPFKMHIACQDKKFSCVSKIEMSPLTRMIMLQEQKIG